jgi:hypothetical protein
MHVPISNIRAWERWKQTGQLALMATFEDSETCTRVKEFCQELARGLGGGCRIVQHVWPFSTFRMKELQDIAAEEAALSDLVVIATRQADGLQDEVKSWIEKWLSQKGDRPVVLVALLERTYEGVPNPTRTYLQQVAQRAGAEFLVDLGEE